MDEAILLVQYNAKYPIASVIVATKASKSLRFGLKSFHDKFISEYSNYFEDYHNISKFKEASMLVETIFEFVPIYKEKT